MGASVSACSAPKACGIAEARQKPVTQQHRKVAEAALSHGEKGSIAL
jgi:hypothetical protein